MIKDDNGTRAKDKSPGPFFPGTQGLVHTTMAMAQTDRLESLLRVHDVCAAADPRDAHALVCAQGPAVMVVCVCQCLRAIGDLNDVCKFFFFAPRTTSRQGVQTYYELPVRVLLRRA